MNNLLLFSSVLLTLSFYPHAKPLDPTEPLAFIPQFIAPEEAEEASESTPQLILQGIKYGAFHKQAIINDQIVREGEDFLLNLRVISIKPYSVILERKEDKQQIKLELFSAINGLG